MADMDKSELLPCPAGHTDVAIERKGTARQSMIIACQECGWRLESGDVFGLTSPDNYAWNRRAPSRPSPGYAEGVEAAAKVAEKRYLTASSYGHTDLAIGFGNDIACAIRALLPAGENTGEDEGNINVGTVEDDGDLDDSYAEEPDPALAAIIAETQAEIRKCFAEVRLIPAELRARREADKGADPVAWRWRIEPYPEGVWDHQSSDPRPGQISGFEIEAEPLYAAPPAPSEPSEGEEEILRELHDAFGSGFTTSTSNGTEGKYILEAKFRDLASLQRAHGALIAALRAASEARGKP